LRIASLVLLTLLAASVSFAQESGEAASRLRKPTYSVGAGIGNSYGWNGFQAEKYFRNGRVSAFGGCGYSPSGEDDRGRSHDGPGWPTLAAGGRWYTAGSKDRAFLEVSVTQLAWEAYTIDWVVRDMDRLYGPGVQVGYQRIAASGFTFVLAGGVGRALGADYASSTQVMISMGIGGTWR